MMIKMFADSGRLKEVLPESIEVTLLADRGFADQKFFRFLMEN